MSDRSFLCCYSIISIEFYIIGKPVHFPLQWCPSCNEHAFVGWAAQLIMWVGPKWNVKNVPATVHCPVGIDAVLSWMGDWMCFEWPRSLHQSGHLVYAPSISMPRSSNLEKARAIGQVEAGVPPESSCGIIWSEPWLVVPSPNWRQSSVKPVISKTDREVGVPRRQHPKKTGSSPLNCQYVLFIPCYW